MLFNQPILCCRTRSHPREYLLKSWREFVTQLQENAFLKVLKWWLRVTDWHHRSVHIVSYWFTATSFLEIIYRIVGLHTLLSCSLLSPAICRAVRVGLQMPSISSEHAGEHRSHFFFQSPGFRKWTQDTKKSYKCLGWRKRNMPPHFCCQRRDVTCMARPPLCVDQCRWITGLSLSLRPRYLSLHWNCQEHCSGTGRSMWMQTAWHGSFTAFCWNSVSL